MIYNIIYLINVSLSRILYFYYINFHIILAFFIYTTMYLLCYATELVSDESKYLVNEYCPATVCLEVQIRQYRNYINLGQNTDYR
jgi:hypothetical protein